MVTHTLRGKDNLYLGDRTAIETNLPRIEDRYMPRKACAGFEESLRFSQCLTEPWKRRRIAVIGDSFSTHLLPAMQKLGKDYPVDIIYKKMTWGTWYPFPPPPETTILRSGQEDQVLHRAVVSTRKAVDQLINNLKDGDTIIFSTFLSTYFSDQFGHKMFSFNDATGSPITRTQALKNWADGIGLLADRGRPKGIRIVIISPLPAFWPMVLNGAKCHRQWFNIENPCRKGFSRRELSSGNKTIDATLEQLKARYPNVLVVDPMDSFCSDSTCYPNSNKNIYFIDAVHLSEAGALHFYQKEFKKFMTRSWQNH